MQATATVERVGGEAATASRFREALALALAAVDADERSGPLIGATGLRIRFAFPDCAWGLDLAAAVEGRNLSWSFEPRAGWQPKLVLEMDWEVANRFLQGRESVAIAIARRRVRVRGDSATALRYLPAIRLICAPYRFVIESDFPDLVAESD